MTSHVLAVRTRQTKIANLNPSGCILQTSCSWLKTYLISYNTKSLIPIKFSSLKFVIERSITVMSKPLSNKKSVGSLVLKPNMTPVAYQRFQSLDSSVPNWSSSSCFILFASLFSLLFFLKLYSNCLTIHELRYNLKLYTCFLYCSWLDI